MKFDIFEMGHYYFDYMDVVYVDRHWLSNVYWYFPFFTQVDRETLIISYLIVFRHTYKTLCISWKCFLNSVLTEPIFATTHP